MKKVNFKNKNGQNITISAVINFPQKFEESEKYPAIVIAHPGGGVKEQTAGLYARKLAGKGSSPLLLTPPIKARARASRASWKTLTSERKTSAP